MDARNATLCTGSRRDDGRVPEVLWRSGPREMSIFWQDSDSSEDYPNRRYPRSREVVS